MRRDKRRFQYVVLHWWVRMLKTRTGNYSEGVSFRRAD